MRLSLFVILVVLAASVCSGQVNSASASSASTTTYKNPPGSCFATCAKNSDCGKGASTGCNTCVNGKCTCAAGSTPCLDDACIGTGTYTYSCMNNSHTACMKGSFGQPAGLCSLTCQSTQACCEGVGAICYDPKTSFCCASTVSAIPVACNNGYKCTPSPVYGTIQANCTDVDECKQNASICGKGYTCNNTVGSYQCNDVNECAFTTCASGYTCQNTPGSFKCVDVDECTFARCKSGYKCVNTPGSFQCADVDECNETPNICGSGYTCANNNGSYVCNDINECKQNNSVCGSGYVCNNTVGNYTCTDVDECQLGMSNCNRFQACQNTPGTFVCDPYEIYIVSQLSGLVLEPDNSSALESPVRTQVKVDGKASQKWKYTVDGFLQNVESPFNLVMDVMKGNPFPGARVILWYHKGDAATNQKWGYDDATGVVHTQSGTAILDILYNDGSVGVPVDVFPQKDPAASNQQFAFVFANQN